MYLITHYLCYSTTHVISPYVQYSTAYTPGACYVIPLCISSPIGYFSISTGIISPGMSSHRACQKHTYCPSLSFNTTTHLSFPPFQLQHLSHIINNLSIIPLSNSIQQPTYPLSLNSIQQPIYSGPLGLHSTTCLSFPPMLHSRKLHYTCLFIKLGILAHLREK